MSQPDIVPPTTETAKTPAPPQIPSTVEPSEPSQPPQSKPSSSKKKSRKPRRPTRRGRRDEGEDDEDGDGGGGDGSEGSEGELSESESEESSSGSEDEEEESPKDEIKKSETATAPIATGQVKSTAWADITDALDENDQDTPVVGMDEFNRHGLDTATSTKGEGSAKKSQNRPEQTEEQKRAKALAKKEKLKAKRLAAKLSKKAGGKDKEDTEHQVVASSSKTDRREEKEDDDSIEREVVTETVSSTSTIPPVPQPRVSNRQAYLAKISSDPSFVPRVGRFWTHDERHYAAGKFGQGDSEYSGLREMSDYWRGRGGGFRGRARGFPMRGMAFRGRGGAFGLPGGIGHVVPVTPAAAPLTSGTIQPSTDATAEEAAQTSEPTKAAPIATADTPAKVNIPSFGKGRWGAGTNQEVERDWNHDGYLQLAKEDERRAAQRARGRGRGGFVQQPRGAFSARGGRGGKFFPPPIATGAPELGQDTVEATTSTSVVVKLPQSATSAEGVFQAQAAETSIEIPEAPLDERATSETASPAPPAEATSDSTHSLSAPPAVVADISSLQLQAEYAALRQQQEIMRQKELRLQDEMRRLEIDQHRLRGGLGSAAMYAVPPSTGSENGSIGSGSASAMAPPPNGTMLPPGVAMTENGSFYEIATGQPVVFVPTPSPGPNGPANGYEQGYRAPPPVQRAPYYPPQNAAPYYQPPMTPDYSSPRGVPQQQQHRQSSGSGSYYPPGGSSMPPMGGRESPYQAAPGPGYFALPRQNSRIQIRAPNASGSPNEDMASAVLKKHERKSSLSNAYVPDQGMQTNGMSYPGGPEYGYAGQQHQQQDPSRYYPQAPQYPAQPQQYPAGTYGEYGYNAQYGAY